MSDLFEKGLEYEKQGDYVNAMQFYLQASQENNAEAQLRIGMMYFTGKGVPKDRAETEKWYELSAQNGNAHALNILGSWYEYGSDGYTVDYQKAADFYSKAAKIGHAKSQCHLGRFYYRGDGVERDLHEAFKWYSKSAEQGYPMAQKLLGSMYELGEFVEQDYKKAHDLYRASADQDYCFAQSRLGTLYEQGCGVDISPSDAIYWWTKATTITNDEPWKWVCGEAAYKLGYAYYDGWGVDRDLSKAKEYFEKAIEYDYNCTYALNMVKRELGEIDDRNKMREYAENITSKNISGVKLYQRVSKDLQKELGSTWSIISKETKKFIETGMFGYLSLYSLGANIYGNLDFSASITPMFKALEKELGRYLYTGYIEYLKNENISPSSFPSKRSFLKQIGAHEFAYKDQNDLRDVTLGNLHSIIGLERKPTNQDKSKYCIDKTMLAYLDSLFRVDAFGEAKREREITNYIVNLSQELKSIADSLRNPAAHIESMKCHRAELCGNYIIKVQKLLIEFLEKIKV